MKSFPKINTPLYALVLLFAATSMLLLFSQGTASAAYKSESIKRVIEEKCNKVEASFNGPKNTEKYKDFWAACKMTGGFAPNGDKRAERAKRLMVICDHPQFLRPMNVRNNVPLYDVYNKGGSIQGGDCDRIKGNDELKNLAAKAYGNQSTKVKDPAFDCAKNPDQCDLVKKYVNPLIYFLGAFVGIAATIGIISGGIRYTTAGDDPQKVAAGQNQIKSAIIAIIAYIVLFAAYKWLVPPV